jgi:phosphatidylglycerophosphate synthase
MFGPGPDERQQLHISEADWRTKPTDRFVLKWIKCHLSARVTPHLAARPWVRPWMVTAASSACGVIAGVIFGLGAGWLAAILAAVSQVLDGVDGQFARLTGRASAAGAFLDSLLDRYADGAMMIGMTVYLVRLPGGPADGWVIAAGGLALISSSAISYTTARAASLDLDLGPPTLASKGTRMTVMILAAVATLFWPALPLVALLYLAGHASLVLAGRWRRICKQAG